MTTRWWPTGGLWRHPDFLRLWAAQIGSAFGSRITRTALPMLAILTIGATPTEVAILSACGVAPAIFVGLLAGGYVDRTAKRPLLIRADLVRAALVLTIPLAAWTGFLSMPQLYAVAALVGAATSVFRIADNTFLPAIVGRDKLVEGNAKLEATDSVAEAAGPGLGGILVQAFTAPVAIVLDGLTYLWSAVLIRRIRILERPSGAHESSSVWHDIVTGFRTCLTHSLLGPLLIAESIANFFNGFLLALYMIVVLDSLRLSPATVGLIIGVGGVGAFLGAAIAQPLGRRLGAMRTVILSLAAAQISYLCIVASLYAPVAAIPLLVTQQLIGDAFFGAYIVHAISLRQHHMPEAVLGRVNATFHAMSGLMLPLGALIAGPLASKFGMATTLWINSIGGLFAAPVLLLALRARRSVIR